jgi:hypothetical protein
MGVPAVAQTEPAPDVCLEIAADAVSGAAWALTSDLIADVVAERSALFPEPTIEAVSHPALLEAAEPTVGLHIDAGHSEAGVSTGKGGCLAGGLEWGARFGRSFLQAGADLMLAEAPTTPGINSSVDIEWLADEDRLRTTLVFAGPLDIPNGTCWIDDALAIDETAGLAVSSAEQGVKTSPFAEGACGRFFDHLPQGGAGEQAVTLFPSQVPLADGRILHFVATELSVVDDAVVVGGVLETR